MPMIPDKSQVIEAIRLVLMDELAAIERTAAAARDEATSGETKAEGKYDTRATEASYLARGQAWRIEELRKISAWFNALDIDAPFEPATARVGALVALDGEQEEVVFIAPVGGTRVTVADTTVRVISPVSPMGDALADLEVGDAFEVDTPRGLLTYEVLFIA